METTGPNAGEQLNGEAISKHWREIPSNWRLGPVGRPVRAALHSMKPSATNTRTTPLKLWKEKTAPRVPTRRIPRLLKTGGPNPAQRNELSWEGKTQGASKIGIQK